MGLNFGQKNKLGRQQKLKEKGGEEGVTCDRQASHQGEVSIQ